MEGEVTRPLAVTLSSRLMECLLPRDLAELVVGDLNEEFALRARSMSAVSASGWFAMQAAASVPRLVLLSVRRLSWFKSLGVAFAAYILLRLVEPYMHQFVSLIVDPGFRLQLLLSLCIGFTACVVGGFVSTWVNRGSAVAYSLISTGFLASMMMSGTNPDLPFWYPTAFLLVAFIAPIVGGVVFIAFAKRLSG